MPEFTTALLDKEMIAEGTMAFHLRKPSAFQFRAGQGIDLTLTDPPETDAEGNTRAFSIASAPTDADIAIATRMRDSAFKRVLKGAALGMPLQLSGPTGSLTLHKNTAKPAVFLAGGIGITPFRSIVRQATAERLPHRLHLFYSNRRPQDAVYLNEFQQHERDNPCFHLIATITQAAAGGWDGETGLIDAAMLRKHLPTFNGPIYYVAGPPVMVGAMRDILVNANVDEDDIRTEDFAGY